MKIPRRSGAQIASAARMNRVCILVLGMHRSGTSMMSRCLNILGVEAPRHLIKGDRNNVKGYWEPMSLNSLHERMLKEAGSSWDDWRGFDLMAIGMDRLDAYRKEIKRLLRVEYADLPLFVLKEPRISRLVSLYDSILKEVDAEPRCILMHRNPLSAIASLSKRDQMNEVFASLVWLRNELAAERDTRDLKRVFVSYESVMENPGRELTAIGKALGLDWPIPLKDALPEIEAFIDPSLQHHAHSLQELEKSQVVPVWAKETYKALSNAHAVEDPQLRLEAFDQIRMMFDERCAIVGDAAFGEIYRQRRLTAEAKADAAEKQHELSHKLASLTSEITKANQVLSEEKRHIAEIEARGEQAVEAARTAAREEAERNAKEFARTKKQNQKDLIKLDKLRIELAARNRALENKADELRNEIAVLSDKNRQANLEIKSLKSEHAHSLAIERSSSSGFNAEIIQLKSELYQLRTSTSWRLTMPMRAVKIALVDFPEARKRTRKRAAETARTLWRVLPAGPAQRQVIKRAVFRLFPFLFKGTSSYGNWKKLFDEEKIRNRQKLTPRANPDGDAIGLRAAITAANANDRHREVSGQAYVGEPLSKKPAKLVGFYLPQFHPIPENDAWWGAGFTEWTNVRSAKPHFKGHYQPRVPADLGYYDLRDVDTFQRQIKLARQYGLEGFCFYFYWFAGKRLLEKPIERYLSDRSLDFPFCLCWANENWSRRWDGRDNEILISQDHSAADDLAFIEAVAPYMRDPRYIRLGGKPLLLVYRPSLLPLAKETADRWRQWCRANGIGEIHLAYTQSFEAVDPSTYGFDAAVEFPPNNSGPPDITSTIEPLRKDFAGTVYDWSVFPERSRSYSKPGYRLYRGVCPSWDNTARRRNKGTVFVNNSPESFRNWLANAIADTRRRFDDTEERLVFVNAWNEWAEGAYLEPDTRFGHAFLNATREALVLETRNDNKSVLLVTHDCHPHGAQFLALGIVRSLRDLKYDTHVLSLGGGPLEASFREAATSFHVGEQDANTTLDYLDALRQLGIRDAIVNTLVAGIIDGALKIRGFNVINLIHEMPKLISERKLQREVKIVAQQADKVVFPAALVAKGFARFTKLDKNKLVIRPQGVLKKNPYKGRRSEAHDLICRRHNLPGNAKIVLNIAYADRRKAPDYFVEIAKRVVSAQPDAIFLWVGHFHEPTMRAARKLVDQFGLAGKVEFVPFTDDPMPYYAAASVYALTSREDPFPNVVLGACDAGTPVVAFAGATGAADYIRENGGALAASFDLDEFAECVIIKLSSEAECNATEGNSLRRYTLDLLHHLNSNLRVSVIVPNYNYEHLLEERMKSIINQKFPIYEIIILDDCSTDRSVEFIERFIQTNADIDVKFIKNDMNSGSVFRQWKKGVEVCNGDLVWIAEADDLSTPEFLSGLTPAFADPSTVMAFSQSKQINENGDLIAENYLDYTNPVSDIWNHDYLRDGKQEISEALHVKNTIPNVSAVVFRRDVIKNSVEKLEEKLFEFKIAGDWILYLEIMMKGRIYFKKESLNIHRRHSASVTKASAVDSHFDEIVKAQIHAQGLVELTVEQKRKASVYLESVREYLDVTPSHGLHTERSLIVAGTETRGLKQHVSSA